MQLLLALSLGLPALRLASARSIWADTPGEYSKLIFSGLPLGNGRLGSEIKHFYIVLLIPVFQTSKI